MPGVSRNVCVFRIGQFGDTVIALPAIHRIAARHPGARMTLITNAPAKNAFVTAWDVLRHTRLFSDVVFYDAARARDLFRLVRACRRLQPAELYYLSPPRTVSQRQRDRMFFAGLCGFNRIVGLDAHPPELRGPDGALLVLPREAERLLRMVDASGPVPATPFLVPPESAETHVQELLAPLAGLRIVALAPGSKMPAKKWFADRYVEIARRIVRHAPDWALAILGGPEDRADGDRIVETVPPGRAVNLAGRAGIIESAAALTRCAFYLGNDTGTMHLAAAMGIPCVAIFTSRENRDVWSPWGDGHTILRRDLPCSGCMLERCEIERMRCLDLITVDDVWAAVAPRLSLSAPRFPQGPATLRGAQP